MSMTLAAKLLESDPPPSPGAPPPKKFHEITLNQWVHRVDVVGWKSLLMRPAPGRHTRQEAAKVVAENPGAVLVAVRSVSAGGRIGAYGGGYQRSVAMKPDWDAMLPPPPSAPPPAT